MESRKEIQIKKKDVQYLLGIVLIPFLLTFILQHFGEFNFKGYGTGVLDYRVTEAHFTTPFGNSVDTVENEGYEQHSGGAYKIKGYYTDRLPFYLKGMFKDSIYTLPIILILLGAFYFRKKYSIKLA